MRSRSHLIRNATIAVLIGSTTGAVAGFWSVRDRTTGVAASATTTTGGVAAPSASTPTTAAIGQVPGDLSPRDGLSSSTAVATKGVVQPTAPGTTENDSEKVVQRARTLAEVPDVYALVALRESVSRRAKEGGEQESPATQALIREIERSLAEARRLRLKLDGEALRRDEAPHQPRTGR